MSIYLYYVHYNGQLANIHTIHLTKEKNHERLSLLNDHETPTRVFDSLN